MEERTQQKPHSRCRAALASVAASVLVVWSGASMGSERPAPIGLLALFPTPPPGWWAQAPSLRPLPRPQFQRPVSTVTPGSARYRARREYRSGTRQFRVTVDTGDIELAAYIESLGVSTELDSTAAAALATAGLTAITVSGRAGIALSRTNSSIRLVKLGRAGVLILQCWQPRCAATLDRFLGHIDLDLLEARTTFYQHSPPNDQRQRVCISTKPIRRKIP